MGAARMHPGRHVAGGRRGDAVGGRIVGGGHERQAEDQKQQQRPRLARQRPHRGGDGGRRVLLAHEFHETQLGGHVHPHHAVAPDDVEGGAAQRAEAHHAADHGAQAAAAGDLGDEQPHERPVGDPPGPVEHRPLGHEAGVADSVRPGVQAHEFLYQQADGRGAELQREQRRAGNQHPHEEHAGQHHVDVGQAPDAALQAEIDAHREDAHANGADHQGEPEGFLQAEQPRGHGAEHRRGQPQRCARAADQGQDEQQVHRPA